MHLTYTALGDSLTVGVGAFLTHGFVKRYAKKLECLYQVPLDVNIRAKPGLTSGQLLHDIAFNEKTRNAIAQADMITITIGGNDLLQAARHFHQPYNLEKSMNQYFFHMRAILNEISTIRSCNPRTYFIQLIGLYNPVPSIPYSDLYLHRYNDMLRSFSSRHITYVDIYKPFLRNPQQLLAGDYHPNNNGYEIIAEHAFLNHLQYVHSKKGTKKG
ncbi:GDSL-type esterase/lipase family protein [Alkalihalobacillus sp. MEB130]|uniref:GDSL-type esterase/lipase family protein n=1 Tax=Alkalihalobacillus sp. MEB130 TaxID=2976704 RepID=UPI0028DFF264|nr:GDSL-type esterase/lipase family protein [Alkalihalobacillus sp. MEB130]MDT8859770.1 GDSL-type esterase/lipase family protein [Alkalihalobacillus sp. MEB130]